MITMCSRRSHTPNTKLLERVNSQIRRHMSRHKHIGSTRWHHKEDDEDVTKTQPLITLSYLAFSGNHGYHQIYEILHRNYCISHSIHNLHIQKSVLELPMYWPRNKFKFARHASSITIPWKPNFIPCIWICILKFFRRIGFILGMRLISL